MAANRLAWLHIGDLHASDEDGWESVERLRRIVEEVRSNAPAGALDFAFLPGDNANHGEPEQYAQVQAALEELGFPVEAIPGDHDFEPGNLLAFARLRGAPLPAVRRLAGRRALFLDIVSAGGGGPDFRLGEAQTVWLERQLTEARAADEPAPVVFMHAFPGDFPDPKERESLGRLLAEAGVAFVDTGHTHYNELINDGAVVYSATRSTGQIEEGPPGFAIATVDGAAASWRFKPLGSPWPFVLITAPTDERLTTARSAAETTAALEVRALVLGRGVERVEASLGDADPLAMEPDPGASCGWRVRLPPPPPGSTRLAVRAFGPGHADVDEIRLRLPFEATTAEILGDATSSVGAWPERGVLGTRLGPNANGRQW